MVLTGGEKLPKFRQSMFRHSAGAGFRRNDSCVFCVDVSAYFVFIVYYSLSSQSTNVQCDTSTVNICCYFAALKILR